MENATKALLIAGSILVVILLIAMGLKIFNTTNGTVESAKTTMNSTEIALFNNQILPYLGDNKRKNDVLNMINKVNAINQTNTQKIMIYFGNGNVSGDLGYILNWVNSNLDSSKLYNISVGNMEDGYIKTINIANQ